MNRVKATHDGSLDPRPRRVEPDLRHGSGVGERAELHLCRAVAYLQDGLVREALDEANAAAGLDPQVRDRALIVARLAVRRELEDEDSTF